MAPSWEPCAVLMTCRVRLATQATRVQATGTVWTADLGTPARYAALGGLMPSRLVLSGNSVVFFGRSGDENTYAAFAQLVPILGIGQFSLPTQSNANLRSSTHFIEAEQRTATPQATRKIVAILAPAGHFPAHLSTCLRKLRWPASHHHGT